MERVVISTPFITRQPSLEQVLQLLSIMFEAGAKDHRLGDGATMIVFGSGRLGKTMQGTGDIFALDPGDAEVVSRGPIAGENLQRSLKAVDGIVQSPLLHEHQS